jgi:hypothetical protein
MPFRKICVPLAVGRRYFRSAVQKKKKEFSFALLSLIRTFVRELSPKHTSAAGKAPKNR